MNLVLPMLPRWLRWSGVLMIAGFIFYTSIIVVPPTVETHDGQDVFSLLADVVGFTAANWRHFLAYGTLALALALATDHWELDRNRQALLVIGMASTYGVAIEVGQYFVPHRVFDLTDILANTLGAMLSLPWFLLRRRIELVPPRNFLGRLKRGLRRRSPK